MDSYQGFCSNKENKYIFNIHTVLHSRYAFQAIIYLYKKIILCVRLSLRCYSLYCTCYLFSIFPQDEMCTLPLSLCFAFPCHVTQ
jgi:hypothetical protein